MAERIIHDNWLRAIIIIGFISIIIILIIFLVFVGIFVFSTTPDLNRIADDIDSIDQSISDISNVVVNIRNDVKNIDLTTRRELPCISTTNNGILSSLVQTVQFAINTTFNSQVNFQEALRFSNLLPQLQGGVKQQIIDNFQKSSDNYEDIVNILSAGNLTIQQVEDIKSDIGEVTGFLQENKSLVENSMGIPQNLKQQLLVKIKDLDVNNQRLAAILRSIGQSFISPNSTPAFLNQGNQEINNFPINTTSSGKQCIQSAFSEIFEIINN